jgi:hypothetical protein
MLVRMWLRTLFRRRPKDGTDRVAALKALHDR